VRELALYFEDVARLLGEELGAELISEPEIRKRGGQSGGLFCSLRYSDGSKLHIELWADCDDDLIFWTDYSFQYLDSENELRFRYDDAPHHHELPFFPHHLHLPDRLAGVPQPRLRGIRERIREYLNPSV
jgi:Family of unknown function (DUF6516)